MSVLLEDEQKVALYGNLMDNIMESIDRASETESGVVVSIRYNTDVEEVLKISDQSKYMSKHILLSAARYVSCKIEEFKSIIRSDILLARKVEFREDGNVDLIKVNTDQRTSDLQKLRRRLIGISI